MSGSAGIWGPSCISSAQLAIHEINQRAGISGAPIVPLFMDSDDSAGGALETDVPQPPPGDATVTHEDLYAGALPTLTAEQVADRMATLLDARAPERFRGDVEPVDPVAGHIPGARNLPSTSVLDDDGSFLSGAELDAVLSVAGISDATGAGVYCGSGITAAVVVAALTAAGRHASLFPGSWSQWSSDPGRPVAVGPTCRASPSSTPSPPPWPRRAPTPR